MLKLYSTGCPSCKAIKKILEDKNVTYEEVTDNDEILLLANMYKINEVPFMVVDGGKILIGALKISEYINGTGD